MASLDQQGTVGAGALPEDVAHIYPVGSRINERGRLEIGGCDVVELAAEHGTPAYVYAEDDILARARAYVEAFRARTDRFEVVYASKAFPCTAAYRLLAGEGIACDVASGGELHLALRGGFAPERIYMHGNNKSDAELEQAVEAGVGHIVLDSFEDIERLGRIAPGQRVMLRVTPGITPSTHSYIATGQVDSKFGFGLDDVPRAIDSLGRLELRGLHAHLGSQIFDLEPFEHLAEVLTQIGDYPLLNLGGGLGIAYTRDQRPPPIEEYVETLVDGAPDGVTVLCEPGRSLVGNAGVTIYRVGTVKQIPGIRTYVAVDGGMSDNLRPMLYGAQYEAEIADRFGGEHVSTIAGKHCESGDILIRDVALDDPRPGDVLVMAATGAYGHAMANNYNGIPRPPVIFCRDGQARVVVRRETFDDLTARDAL
jgi:diaminopimelate decarboxylase